MNRIVYEEVKDESDGTTPRLEEALHDAWSYAPGEMPGKYIGKRNASAASWHGKKGSC